MKRYHIKLLSKYNFVANFCKALEPFISAISTGCLKEHSSGTSVMREECIRPIGKRNAVPLPHANQ